MKNRFGIEVKKGYRVTCHLVRGGMETGIVSKIARMPGYGWRVQLECGMSFSLDDVLSAQSMVRVVILAGKQWRGVRYYEDTPFDLSDDYARHVVETLKVARYGNTKGTA